MNPLTERKLTPQEQLVFLELFEERYTQTPPIMTPDAEASHHVSDKWTKCGDDGLILPWKILHTSTPDDEEKSDYRAFMKDRHDQFRADIGHHNVPVQDRERLSLTLKTEEAAIEKFENPDRFHSVAGKKAHQAYLAAFGALADHDYSLGHPVADPTRDLTKEPITREEQVDWMHRDGREPTRDDIAYKQISELYNTQSRSTGREEGRRSTDGEWFRPGEDAPMRVSKVGQEITGTERMAMGRESATWVNNHAMGREQGIGPAMQDLIKQRREAGIDNEEQKKRESRSM